MTMPRHRCVKVHVALERKSAYRLIPYNKMRQHPDLLPSNPFAPTLHYAAHREVVFSVFLDDPAVSIETNNMARSPRATTTMLRNCLSAWTHLGVQRMGGIQSLLLTCRLQGVDTYTNLLDVVQRVDEYLAKNTPSNSPRRFGNHVRRALSRVPNSFGLAPRLLNCLKAANAANCPPAAQSLRAIPRV